MSAVDAVPLLAAAGGDYQILRSVRIRAAATAYFSRTPASASNRTTWTWSGWIKRGKLSTLQGILGVQVDIAANPLFRVNIGAGDIFTVIENNSGGTALYQLSTNAVFRDPSAWYHLIIVFDSTNATSTERLRMYVNGVRITSFLAAIYPALNQVSLLNSTTTHQIGRLASNDTINLFDGYLTEINFIDGQALTPSSFGEFDAITGVWKPKKYTGTYGTNGFYLNFSDNSAATAAAIGKDYSGNGNNWTPNNISVTAGATYDSMLDVPTMWDDGGNGRGNYATLNPLVTTNAAPTTFSEANLRVDFGSSSTGWAHGSIGVSTGKWYAEFTLTSVSSTNAGVGLKSDSSLNYAGFSANSYAYENSGNKRTNDTASAYGASFTSGNVIGVAYDADVGTLTFYKNNVSQGQAFSGITGTNYFVVSDNSTSPTCVWQANFGQRPFTYTPPTGFKALNTQNLPASTIVKGSLHFNALLDTGANIKAAANAAYTYVLEWIKDRANANNHQLADTNRGLTAILQSNTTAAETTYVAPSGSSVAWVWNLLSAAVTNTAGSITSQVAANVSAGISVVTYTGSGANATVGHGLGVAPSLMILKRRNSTGNWPVYHRSYGGNGGAFFNLANAAAVSVNFWNNTNPTATVFTLSSANECNVAGSTNVAYCFAEVSGFSKINTYTGNGSVDGPFVYCGFRPRFILLKDYSISNNWVILDTSRDPYNVAPDTLNPNLINAESLFASGGLDILSNGFKIRTTSAAINTSGNAIVYAVFAENPFKNALAR